MSNIIKWGGDPLGVTDELTAEQILNIINPDGLKKAVVNIRTEEPVGFTLAPLDNIVGDGLSAFLAMIFDNPYLGNVSQADFENVITAGLPYRLSSKKFDFDLQDITSSNTSTVTLDLDNANVFERVMQLYSLWKAVQPFIDPTQKPLLEQDFTDWRNAIRRMGLFVDKFSGHNYDASSDSSLTLTQTPQTFPIYNDVNIVSTSGSTLKKDLQFKSFKQVGGSNETITVPQNYGFSNIYFGSTDGAVINFDGTFLNLKQGTNIPFKVDNSNAYVLTTLYSSNILASSNVTSDRIRISQTGLGTAYGEFTYDGSNVVSSKPLQSSVIKVDGGSAGVVNLSQSSSGLTISSNTYITGNLKVSSLASGRMVYTDNSNILSTNTYLTYNESTKIFGTAELKYTGNGSNITNLNATNISSGTVPVARLPDATEVEKGVCKIVVSTTSTSITDAAAPSSVAETMTRANAAFDKATAAKSTADGAVTQIETLQTTVSGIQTEITGIQASITAVQTDVTALQTSVATAQSTADTALTDANAAQFSANEAITQAGTAQSTAEAAQASASGAYGYADAAASSAAAAAITASLLPLGATTVAIGNAVSGKASQSDLDSLSGTVSTVNDRQKVYYSYGAGGSPYVAYMIEGWLDSKYNLAENGGNTDGNKDFRNKIYDTIDDHLSNGNIGIGTTAISGNALTVYGDTQFISYAPAIVSLPMVPITSSTSGLPQQFQGTYGSSQSSQGGGGNSAVSAFRLDGTATWYRGNGVYTNYNYDTNSDGNPRITSNVDGSNSIAGEWIELILPSTVNFNLTGYRLLCLPSRIDSPRSWTVLGSNDSGSTWTTLDEKNNASSDDILITSITGPRLPFTRFRFIVRQIRTTATTSNSPIIAEWTLNGFVSSYTEPRLAASITGAIDPDNPTNINIIGNVGINTTAPTQSLDVIGSVKATSFIGDGSQLSNLAIPSTFSNGTFSGTVSASNFIGNGSLITKISASNLPSTMNATTFNGNVTASNFIGNGSGLTGLTSAQIPSTLNATTFSGAVVATSFAGNGSLITNISASNLPSTMNATTFSGTISAPTLTVSNATVSNTLTLGNLVLTSGTFSTGTVTGTSGTYGDLKVTGNLICSSNATVSNILTTQALNIASGSLAIQNIFSCNVTVSNTLTGSNIAVSNIAIGSLNNSNAHLYMNYVSGCNSLPLLLIEDATAPDSSPFVITSNGSVGIGKTNPTQKLYVNGSSYLNGNTNVTGTFTTSNIVANNYLTIGQATYCNAYNLFNTGTTYLGNTLVINNPSGTGLSVFGQTNLNSNLAVYGNLLVSQPSSFLDNVTVTNGSVGIGTNSPSDKLQVNGGTTVNGTFTVNGYINMNNTATINSDLIVNATSTLYNLIVNGSATMQKLSANYIAETAGLTLLPSTFANQSFNQSSLPPCSCRRFQELQFTSPSNIGGGQINFFGSGASGTFGYGSATRTDITNDSSRLTWAISGSILSDARELDFFNPGIYYSYLSYRIYEYCEESEDVSYDTRFLHVTFIHNTALQVWLNGNIIYNDASSATSPGRNIIIPSSKLLCWKIMSVSSVNDHTCTIKYSVL